MESSSRDRINVDLHGPKAALMERAQALGVSPSELVRKALADEIGQSAGKVNDQSEKRRVRGTGDRTRRCLRMGREQAAVMLTAAHRAGLTSGDYVAGLVAGVPAVLTGVGRPDHVAALVASNADLFTLRRNIHRLTNLLRQGDVVPALVYCDMLKALDGGIRHHLVLAAGVLAELCPRSVRPKRHLGPTSDTEGDAHGTSTEH